MGLFFEPYKPSSCCLCGSAERLTGEHKIKASALRNEFGKAQLYVGVSDDDTVRHRLAQSTNSKYLKFVSRMCENCNSHLTQPADNEFDRFLKLTREYISAGDNPDQIFSLERYAIGTAPYLNVFRYFAKLLASHMADVEAPRCRKLFDFASGRIHSNNIWLKVRQDPVFAEIERQTGETQYAAHGGLTIDCNKQTLEPKALHSTLTIGPVQFVYFSNLNFLERLELKLFHKEFYKWCQKRARESLAEPMTKWQKTKLGFGE